MPKILFLSPVEDNGTLSNPALEALTAAMSLGGELILGLWGQDPRPGADQAAACGASRFLAASGADLRDARYATDAAAAEALIRASGADIVVMPGTSRVLRIAAGAAYRLGGAVDTHVTALSSSGGVEITRWYYRQRMEAKITRQAKPWLICVDSGTQPAYALAPGSASVEAVAVSLDDGSKRTKMEGFKTPAGGMQTIRPDADLLFVAGAGWTKKQADGAAHVKEAEALIVDFLKKKQASLGSTKSLVDLSAEGGDVLTIMSHLNQVGQTGATPRHPRGLATCCHGEEPHVVGWRFINQRRAVNKDANCGWAHGKADVLYVADAFEVMKKVNALIG